MIAPMTVPTAASTAMDCSNPDTCFNRFCDQIYAVSARWGTEVTTLNDPNSLQARVANLILEECNAVMPVNLCTKTWTRTMWPDLGRD
jgi:hypothetical protein